MKKKWIKNYKWVKENLNIILVIPTLIGGFWQLIELSTISTAYIRFFSISQVIPDGLLVLFIIFLIIGSYHLAGLLIKWSPFYKAQMPSWVSAITVAILLLLAYSIIGHELYKSIKQIGYFRISDIAVIILMVTFFFGAFVNLIPHKTKLKYLKLQDRGDEKNKDTKENKLIEFVSILIASLVLIFTFSTLIFFLGVVGNLRKSYIQTENLINIEKIESKISEQKTDKVFEKILYFNDKYFFVQFKDKNAKEYIRVFRTEEMFDMK